MVTNTSRFSSDDIRRHGCVHKSRYPLRFLSPRHFHGHYSVRDMEDIVVDCTTYPNVNYTKILGWSRATWIH